MASPPIHFPLPHLYMNGQRHWPWRWQLNCLLKHWETFNILCSSFPKRQNHTSYASCRNLKDKDNCNKFTVYYLVWYQINEIPSWVYSWMLNINKISPAVQYSKVTMNAHCSKSSDIKMVKDISELLPKQWSLLCTGYSSFLPILKN